MQKTGYSWQVKHETKYLGVGMFVTKKVGDFVTLDKNFTSLQEGNDTVIW